MGADDQEISVRALMRSLPSLAAWSLFACVVAWAISVWREPNPPPFWVFVLAWPAITISIGPLAWLRFDRDSHAPGWWRALALAFLWGCCVAPLLLALVYSTAAKLLGF